MLPKTRNPSLIQGHLLITPKPQLSLGVGFIYDLVNAPSLEAKRSILDAGIGATFRDGSLDELSDILLMNVYDGDEHFWRRCDSIAPHQYGQPNDDDMDLGPYQAWLAESPTYLTQAFFPPDEWLRDCAYVFWDSDRVQKMGGFGNKEYLDEALEAYKEEPTGDQAF